jgi:hypothetical protein
METQNRLADRIAAIEHFFLRVVALVLIAVAIQYWMKVTGLNQPGGMRFDLLPSHWQAVAAVLSVILPVAALGLWGLNGWGVVVWIAAAATEIAMHTVFAGRFGVDAMKVAFHATALALLATLWLVRRIALRRANAKR